MCLSKWSHKDSSSSTFHFWQDPSQARLKKNIFSPQGPRARETKKKKKNPEARQKKQSLLKEVYDTYRQLRFACGLE